MRLYVLASWIFACDDLFECCGCELTVNMDDEKLILLVCQYIELYDFSNQDYSNQERKDNCWKEIAEEMKLTGQYLFYNNIILFIG